MMPLIKMESQSPRPACKVCRLSSSSACGTAGTQSILLSWGLELCLSIIISIWLCVHCKIGIPTGQLSACWDLASCSPLIWQLLCCSAAYGCSIRHGALVKTILCGGADLTLKTIPDKGTHSSGRREFKSGLWQFALFFLLNSVSLLF